VIPRATPSCDTSLTVVVVEGDLNRRERPHLRLRKHPFGQGVCQSIEVRVAGSARQFVQTKRNIRSHSLRTRKESERRAALNELRMPTQFMTREIHQQPLVAIQVFLTVAQVHLELFPHFLIEMLKELLPRTRQRLIDLAAQFTSAAFDRAN